MSLGQTYTFNPSLLNEFHLAYTRLPITPVVPQNSLVNFTQALQEIKGLNLPVAPPLQPIPNTGIGSNYGFGPNSMQQIQSDGAFIVSENVTKVRAQHSLKGGFIFRDDQVGNEYPAPTSLSFGGGLMNNPITGQGGSNGLAQFELGAVDQGSNVRYVPATYHTTHYWGFYVQDDWRLTRKLTLNVGLRYDLYGWFRERHNNASVFDFNRTNPQDTVRLGAIDYLGTPAHPNPTIFPANKNDLAPRINFAYALTPKTVIRGGGDVMYSNGFTTVLGMGTGASESPGYNYYDSWWNDATGQGYYALSMTPAFILSQGAPNLPPYPNPKVTDDQLLGPSGGVLTMVQATHDPDVYMWNFGVQRELPGNMVIKISYVGSQGRHLTTEENRNYSYVHTSTRLKYRSQLSTELVPMPADLAPLYGSQYLMSQLFVAYPQYPYVQNFASLDANTDYNGFQLSLEKRYSHGLNFQVAYTAQKTIGSVGAGGYNENITTAAPNVNQGRGRVTSVTGAWTGSQDPDNRAGDRTLTADDTPQILNIAATYELPFGRDKMFLNQKGIVSGALGGWKLSGTFNAEGGLPLSASGPSNWLTSRPNLIGNPNLGRSEKTRYQYEHGYYNVNALEPVFGLDPSIIQLATYGTPQQQDQHDEFWRFGTMGQRSGMLRAPGFWGSNMALLKDFKIREEKRFQVRIESYNTFNHQALTPPNTGWCLPPNADGSVDAVHQFGCQFGWINGVASTPRYWKFGVSFYY